MIYIFEKMSVAKRIFRILNGSQFSANCFQFLIFSHGIKWPQRLKDSILGQIGASQRSVNISHHNSINNRRIAHYLDLSGPNNVPAYFAPLVGKVFKHLSQFHVGSPKLTRGYMRWSINLETRSKVTKKILFWIMGRPRFCINSQMLLDSSGQRLE